MYINDRIKEQTRRLRQASVETFTLHYNETSILLREAANTIDELYEKLSVTDALNDIAEIQKAYQRLIDEHRLSKKEICDLVIPFRDAYNLTDSQALAIARAELSVSEINDLLKDKKQED